MLCPEEVFLPHASAHGSNGTLTARRSRDNSPAGRSAREPFPSDETFTATREPIAELKPTEALLEGLVERLVSFGAGSNSSASSTDSPFEALPAIDARELAAIGRAVSFSTSRTVSGGTKTKVYYTGLVSTVTATAVTLLHVTRYTDEDFDIYKKRERTLSRRVASRASELKSTVSSRNIAAAAASSSSKEERQKSGLLAYGYSADGEVGVDAAGQLSAACESIAMLQMEAAGSLTRVSAAHPATETEKAAFVGEALATPGHSARAAHHALVSTTATTVGPFPCVTFARRTMHDVKFGRDPRSSFYSLFQDPSKELMDTQYLRMFVRRYLVHTSQGRNAAQVPLYAYVEARSGSAHLDHAFVYKLVREELPDLIKTDRAIESERRRLESLEAEGRGPSGAHREQDIPTGFFAATGVLHRARLPHKSFIAGVGLLLFTAATAVCVGVSIALVVDPFIVNFLFSTLWFVVGALGVWVLATIATLAHALFMRAELRKQLPLLVGRVALCSCAIGGSIMSIAVIIVHLSSGAVYNYMARQPKTELCDFYERNECSGLYGSCNGLWWDRALCKVPCVTYVYADQTCAGALWTPILRVFVPVLIFALVVLFLSLYSLMLVANVVLISRRAARRRR